MEKEELLKYIKKRIDTFEFKNYIEENNTNKNNGAIGIITPNQMILSKTLNEGKADHNPTFNIINKLIYNMPMEENEIHHQFNIFLMKHQNIYIRIFNEQFSEIFGNIKSIWVHLPDCVTETQLNFLKQLEQEYGDLIKHISLKQCETDKDQLVGFNKLDGETVLDDSFKSVIEYIEEYLLDNHKAIIQEATIIGKTLPDINYEKMGRQI